MFLTSSGHAAADVAAIGAIATIRSSSWSADG